jgi:hypothetical protein
MGIGAAPPAGGLAGAAMAGAAPQPPQLGAEQPPPQPESQDDLWPTVARRALILSQRLTFGHGSLAPAQPPLLQELHELLLWNREPEKSGVPQAGAHRGAAWQVLQVEAW